jgi:hypothetical protein
MNKLCIFSGSILLAMSVSLPSWANPCMPIAQACMGEGYYKGGDKEGKGLIKDCVMPVVNGQKTLNTTFSADVMQQCKTTIEQKMQTNPNM